MLFLHYHLCNKKGRKERRMSFSLVALINMSPLMAADRLGPCDWLKGKGVELGRQQTCEKLLEESASAKIPLSNKGAPAETMSYLDRSRFSLAAGVRGFRAF